jgi:putative cyclase
MKKNAVKASHLVQSSLGFIITLFAYQNLPGQQANDLWQVYQATLRKAKYVDLTHTITPTIPVWKGFGPSRFTPTVNPENGQPYNYDKDGFAATAYQFSTDQLGTQLDPPAH